MWESVELREIRAFLALSEELHFGRSAERLGLTPSRVSQTIRELEAKLGAPLFSRTSRRVALTPLGERLRDTIRGPHEQLAGALRRLAPIAGPLRLALGSSPSGGGPRLLEIIAAFEARHPACPVRIGELDWSDLLGPLRRGEIDLMATRLPLAQPDIALGPVLSRADKVLAVARDHPLAGRASVTLEDVADHRVARFDTFPPEQIEALVPSRAPSGRPIVRAEARPGSLSELLTLVARGAIVHPTCRALGEYVRHPGVVLVPLAGMAPVETALAWRRGNDDPRVESFVATAEAVLSLEPVAAAAHGLDAP